MTNDDYAERVRVYEEQGMCTSDAQAVVDAEDARAADSTLAGLRQAFGIEDKPIDTAARRLHSWALVAIGGSINVVRVGDTMYTWDASPRRLQNGAVQGRVYAQARGENPRDVGGFKIDARGRVLQLPAELRAVLPGGHDAGDEAAS